MLICNISTAKLILNEELKGPEWVGRDLNQRNPLRGSYKKLQSSFKDF